jgi:hypothetical protein
MNSGNNDRINNALSHTTSRRNALKLMGGGLIGGLGLAAGIKGASAHGALAQGRKTEGAGTWSFSDLAGVGNELVEAAYPGGVSLVPRHFAKEGDGLTLTGDAFYGEELVGTFSAPVLMDTIFAGSTMASVSSGVTSDVSLAQAGACDILTLEIAPIFLDLLGLQVELPNPLVLEIRAVPGAGNLLGNLLCAVAGLLDGNSPLGGLAGLLNNILRALGLA